VLLAALFGCAAPVAALPVPTFRFEPVHVGAIVLDDLYKDVAGVESGTAVRLGVGVALAWSGGLELGCSLGRSALHTDFGLLDAAQVRMERADTGVELRYRPPFALGGWGAQAGASLGRVSLGYRPDHVELSAGGETIGVDLDDVGAWTQGVAAELLHGWPGGTQIVLRTAWTFYALRIATPAGAATRSVHDLVIGVSLRARPW
jgi:hypothetical protein